MRDCMVDGGAGSCWLVGWWLVVLGALIISCRCWLFLLIVVGCWCKGQESAKQRGEQEDQTTSSWLSCVLSVAHSASWAQGVNSCRSQR